MTNEPKRLEITGHHLALHKALNGKDAQLAGIYYGTLLVLHQSENPERLALAAHGFRELMEKLPRYLDVPALAKPITLTERVRILNQSWDKTLKRSQSYNDHGWSGDIDKFLQKFLGMMHEFFEQLKIDRPKRKEQAMKIIRKLDPLDRPLPAPIENLRVKEWDAIRGYFENVSHHNASANPEEFQAWRSQLERFLLDSLVPRTFEDHTAIDEIIREGEGDAET